MAGTLDQTDQIARSQAKLANYQFEIEAGGFCTIDLQTLREWLCGEKVPQNYEVFCKALVLTLRRQVLLTHLSVINLPQDRDECVTFLAACDQLTSVTEFVIEHPELESDFNDIAYRNQMLAQLGVDTDGDDKNYWHELSKARLAIKPFQPERFTLFQYDPRYDKINVPLYLSSARCFQALFDYLNRKQTYYEMVGFPYPVCYLNNSQLRHADEIQYIPPMALECLSILGDIIDNKNYQPFKQFIFSGCTITNELLEVLCHVIPSLSSCSITDITFEEENTRLDDLDFELLDRLIELAKTHHLSTQLIFKFKSNDLPETLMEKLMALQNEIAKVHRVEMMKATLADLPKNIKRRYQLSELMPDNLEEDGWLVLPLPSATEESITQARQGELRSCKKRGYQASLDVEVSFEMTQQQEQEQEQEQEQNAAPDVDPDLIEGEKLYCVADVQTEFKEHRASFCALNLKAGDISKLGGSVDNELEKVLVRVLGAPALPYSIPYITETAMIKLCEYPGEFFYGFHPDNCPVGFYIGRNSEGECVFAYDAERASRESANNPLTVSMAPPQLEMVSYGDAGQFGSSKEIKLAYHVLFDEKKALDRENLLEALFTLMRADGRDLANVVIKDYESFLTQPYCQLNDKTKCYFDEKNIKAFARLLASKGLFALLDMLELIKRLHNEAKPKKNGKYEDTSRMQFFYNFKKFTLDRYCDFTNLYNQRFRQTIERIIGSNNIELDWLTHLCVAQSAVTGQYNLSELFDAFDYFRENLCAQPGIDLIETHCRFNWKRSIEDNRNAGCVKPALDRLLTIISSSRKPAEQVRHIEGLSLYGDDAFYAVQYEGFRFVSQEMKLIGPDATYGKDEALESVYAVSVAALVASALVDSLDDYIIKFYRYLGQRLYRPDYNDYLALVNTVKDRPNASSILTLFAVTTMSDKHSQYNNIDLVQKLEYFDAYMAPEMRSEQTCLRVYSDLLRLAELPQAMTFDELLITTEFLLHHSECDSGILHNYAMQYDSACFRALENIRRTGHEFNWEQFVSRFESLQANQLLNDKQLNGQLMIVLALCSGEEEEFKAFSCAYKNMHKTLGALNTFELLTELAKIDPNKTSIDFLPNYDKLESLFLNSVKQGYVENPRTLLANFLPRCEMRPAEQSKLNTSLIQSFIAQYVDALLEIVKHKQSLNFTEADFKGRKAMQNVMTVYASLTIAERMLARQSGFSIDKLVGELFNQLRQETQNTLTNLGLSYEKVDVFLNKSLPQFEKSSDKSDIENIEAQSNYYSELDRLAAALHRIYQLAGTHGSRCVESVVQQFNVCQSLSSFPISKIAEFITALKEGLATHKLQSIPGQCVTAVFDHTLASELTETEFVSYAAEYVVSLMKDNHIQSKVFDLLGRATALHLSITKPFMEVLDLILDREDSSERLALVIQLLQQSLMSDSAEEATSTATLILSLITVFDENAEHFDSAHLTLEQYLDCFLNRKQPNAGNLFCQVSTQLLESQKDENVDNDRPLAFKIIMGACLADKNSKFDIDECLVFIESIKAFTPFLQVALANLYQFPLNSEKTYPSLSELSDILKNKENAMEKLAELAIERSCDPFNCLLHNSLEELYDTRNVRRVILSMRNILTNKSLFKSDAKCLQAYFHYINSIGYKFPIPVRPSLENLNSEIEISEENNSEQPALKRSLISSEKCLFEFTPEEIRTLIQINQTILYDERATEKDKLRARLQFLACARQVMFRETGKLAYETQMIAVLNSMIFNRSLAEEIRTGEGKAITSALIAALTCFEGKLADVSSANFKLTEDNFEEFKPFFDALGFDCVLIKANSPQDTYLMPSTREYYSPSDITTERKYRHGGIHYSTAAELALFKQIRALKGIPSPSREEMTAIFDEFDFMAQDEVIQYRLSLPAPNSLHKYHNPDEWVYPIIYDFVATEQFKSSEYGRWDDVENCRVALLQNANQEQRTLLEMINDDQIDIWIDSADAVTKMEQDTDFILSYEGERCLPNGDVVEISYARVASKAKDRKNTTAQFGNGVQQFLHVRLERERLAALGTANALRTLDGAPHGCFPIDPEHLHVSAMSVKNLIDSYGRVIGLTGTISECQLLHQLYNLTFLSMPPHNIDKRKDKNPVVYRTASEQRDWVLSNIRSEANDTVCPPIVIFCRDIPACEKMFQYLKKKGLENWKTITQISIYHGGYDDNLEAQVVKTASQPGSVLVTTGILGRGTDFKPPRHVPLVVIATSAEDVRKYRQWLGRSGRNGAIGKTITILNAEDAPNIFLYRYDLGIGMAIKRFNTEQAIKELQAATECQASNHRRFKERYSDLKLVPQKQFAMLLLAISNVSTLDSEVIKCALVQDWKYFINQFDAYWGKLLAENRSENYEQAFELMMNYAIQKWHTFLSNQIQKWPVLEDCLVDQLDLNASDFAPAAADPNVPSFSTQDEDEQCVKKLKPAKPARIFEFIQSSDLSLDDLDTITIRSSALTSASRIFNNPDVRLAAIAEDLNEVRDVHVLLLDKSKMLDMEPFKADNIFEGSIFSIMGVESVIALLGCFRTPGCSENAKIRAHFRSLLETVKNSDDKSLLTVTKELLLMQKKALMLNKQSHNGRVLQEFTLELLRYVRTNKEPEHCDFAKVDQFKKQLLDNEFINKLRQSMLSEVKEFNENCKTHLINDYKDLAIDLSQSDDLTIPTVGLTEFVENIFSLLSRFRKACLERDKSWDDSLSAISIHRYCSGTPNEFIQLINQLQARLIGSLDSESLEKCFDFVIDDLKMLFTAMTEHKIWEKFVGFENLSVEIEKVFSPISNRKVENQAVERIRRIEMLCNLLEVTLKPQLKKVTYGYVIENFYNQILERKESFDLFVEQCATLHMEQTSLPTHIRLCTYHALSEVLSKNETGPSQQYNDTSETPMELPSLQLHQTMSSRVGHNTVQNLIKCSAQFMMLLKVKLQSDPSILEVKILEATLQGLKENIALIIKLALGHEQHELEATCTLEVYSENQGVLANYPEIEYLDKEEAVATDVKTMTVVSQQSQ